MFLQEVFIRAQFVRPPELYRLPARAVPPAEMPVMVDTSEPQALGAGKKRRLDRRHAVPGYPAVFDQPAVSLAGFAGY